MPTRHSQRAILPARATLLVSWAMFLMACSTSALAGGGPENVLLVVNPKSHASLTIANHYQHLRRIPPCNVVYLPWEPKRESTDVDTFRREILIPVLRAIDERRLAAQIDYVVYSCDFPWGINLESDIGKFTEAMKREQPGGKFEWPKQLTAIGSLTGLTYLLQPVATGHPAYLEMDSNWYMPQAAPDRFITASRGFRSSRQFDRQGEITQSGGRRYLLSTMLGVTAGRGNSLDEVLSYLRRSATADGTHPKGTIYFVKNGDIRSKVRHGLFPAAVEEIEKLGVAAEILEGTVPIEPQRRAGRGDGHGRLRLEGLRQHHPARRHLRTLHQFRRRDERRGRAKRRSRSSSATARPAPAAP